MPNVQSEPIDAKRIIPVFLVDLQGNGIAGQVGGVTIKISKPGNNWVAPGGGTALTEVTGGEAGSYRLAFDVGDWDTIGPLYYSVSRPGVVRPFVDYIPIDPNVGDVLHYGKSPAGSTAATLKLGASASAVDGFYADANKACIAMIIDGNGKGQARIATGYTGAGKVLAISPNWDASALPDATTVYKLLPITGQLAAAVTTGIQTAILAAIATIPTNPVLVSDARIAHLDADISSRLKATVAGHEGVLVDAQGHVGLDWGQLANPATVHNLSATTVSGGGGGGGDPTANADAVLAAVIDPHAPANAQTVQQALNIIRDYIVGELTGVPTSINQSVAYEAAGGNKTRIAGTTTNGVRTITIMDGSP